MPDAVLPSCLQHAGQASKVTLTFNDHGVASKVVLDLFHLAVENCAAFVDQHDAVAQRLNLVHLVGGHDDRLAGLALLLDHLLDQPRVDRVQPGEGFVHDDQVRFVGQRGDDLGFLLHATAEFLDFFLTVVVQVEPLQVYSDSLAGGAFAHSFEGGQEDQRRFQFEVFVETSLLRQVADAIFPGLVEFAAKDGNLTAIGLKDIEQQTNRSRFTGAVGSQQAKDLTWVDLK